MNKLTAFVFVALFVFVHPIFAEEICSESSDQTALIVIDMQRRFVTRGGNHEIPANVKAVEDITKAQVEAIHQAKRARIPIVFLEYEGYGDTNSELKAAVRGYDRVRFILKDTDGMFSGGNAHRKELIEYLQSNNVGRLVITGANGGACVESSITGALDGNCTVLAYSQGIADFNYREFIFPYTGHYDNIKPNCRSCRFSETMSFEEVSRLMTPRGAEADRTRPGRE